MGGACSQDEERRDGEPWTVTRETRATHVILQDIIQGRAVHVLQRRAIIVKDRKLVLRGDQEVVVQSGVADVVRHDGHKQAEDLQVIEDLMAARKRDEAINRVRHVEPMPPVVVHCAVGVLARDRRDEPRELVIRDLKLLEHVEIPKHEPEERKYSFALERGRVEIPVVDVLLNFITYSSTVMILLNFISYSSITSPYIKFIILWS